MYGVCQQHDVGVGRRIDPQRCAREPGMPVTADGQQFSAIGGERRIDVPAKSSQRGSVDWLLRRGHLRNRRRSQHATPTIKQRLGKSRQVVGGRE